MAIWKFGRQNSKNCCWISRRSWSVAPTLGQDENFQKAMAEAMQQAAVGHWVAWVSLLLTVNQLVNRTGATWKLFNQLVIYLAARNQAVAFKQSCDWKVPTQFQPFGAPCILSFPARPRPRSPSLPSRSPGVPGLPSLSFIWGWINNGGWRVPDLQTNFYVGMGQTSSRMGAPEQTTRSSTSFFEWPLCYGRCPSTKDEACSCRGVAQFMRPK